MRLPTPYRDETGVVSQRLEFLSDALDWRAATYQAAPWVENVRRHPPPFWAMESLLREYPISSAEGLALMRLAEALLRVPDAPTAIALTADQLGRADFSAAHDSALSRLSSSAISLSKKFLPDADHPPGLMARLGAKSVVAATLRAVQLLGRQFVLGQTIGEAMGEARSARSKHPQLHFSYDMLGEGARTDADARHYLESYIHAIQSIAKESRGGAGTPEQIDGISIKLSALHPRYEAAQKERVMRELVPRVWQLCTLAAPAHLNLTIDAEEVDRLELSLDVFEELASRVAAEYPQWQGFGLALQAYQTRALELIDHVAAIARKYRLRLMCRLVKGAYWDAEIKRAQELGLPHYPVFTHKHHSDVSYLACARALLAAPDAIYPQFATHNAGTIAAILQMASRTAVSSSKPTFELQRLHGMGEGVFREVMKSAPQVPVRVYAPVGQHKDLLAYLVRRLLENGANSSFVNQLGDDHVPLDELLASPLHLTRTSEIALPARLYGPLPARANSAGLDLAVDAMTAPLFAALERTTVPTVDEASEQAVQRALLLSRVSFRDWRRTPVKARATMLREAADALQSELPRFCALLVKEAFKTWGDAVSEVREAIDFLRYYADEAERIMQPMPMPGPTGESNTLCLVPRGPWVCISPWNFPLAIFAGQVAAALATGNSVLAKPAEQTPGVALEMVKLLHRAGVPADVLQLLHGAGETVGAALVAGTGVEGVVFTGSTQVARIIHRALAAKDGPIVPLIAETGGINAMVVDSSALPEQVVDAVVQSAFRSAGQRCSALRLLCVHEGIADDVIEMIRGAAAELSGGDTARLATDVGPLIDREAFDNVARAAEGLDATQKVLLNAQEPADATRNFMPPRAYEVDSIDSVRNEIFGPVLQIVRWSGEAGDVIERINALGYGLTLGIQTRIDSRAAALAVQAHVGNVYVNRNIIGAVVGVQPFGGEGLSGTGPKAGGPHYLYRFCAEQTVTINTTAAGGNAALLGGVAATA
ncbi:L-glutamate gamma-semialdehyde dehydrogenase [Variovorax sp. J22R133]|uniref:L-glutamate gamma-semialdehyde dehydrogenase n=1 Tax=Variovorax brevis TaxID=3053503 RepID=UPI0025750053|nr:L-glutamate gamma-semialdehyde dehydrogenase [Variovorax sp. J22R133]MDM0115712.1 L-glutamate gamma-semialdehyde dehydrogenase [Variovorax sp. J22R133]